MQLREIMSHQVETVPPECSLKEAAQQMKSLDVGSLPVCRNDKLIGVITDRDIAIRAVAKGQDPNTSTVNDAMTGECIFCYEDDDVENAVKMMEARQIRRLPVLDRSKHLVGIISLGDLATRWGNDKLSGEVLGQVSQQAQA